MAVNLIARFACRGGAREVVADLIGAYAEHVNASPGTVRFEVYTERDDPNQFVIIECYSSNKTKYAGLCVVVSQSRVGYETRHECVFQVEV